jgi:hypothetical protein
MYSKIVRILTRDDPISQYHLSQPRWRDNM